MRDAQQVREAVEAEVVRYLEEEGREVAELRGDDGLVDLGVDSLGFAVLIARLEDALGYDPFDAFERGEFPRTVDELVVTYTGRASDG